MARIAELVITFTRGELRTGLWCDDCALPSRFEQDLYSLTKFGVTTVVMAGCTEHRRDDDE